MEKKSQKYPFAFQEIDSSDSIRSWNDWRWQFKNSLKTREDFQKVFDLSSEESQGFDGLGTVFRVQTTPYYAQVIAKAREKKLRRIIIPTAKELEMGEQSLDDPLGEKKNENRVGQRLVHRYSDRVLFLATDLCGVYCRYCTRKHFTASGEAICSSKDLQEAVRYVEDHPGIREVIFSGGDPLTLSNDRLETFISAFRQIRHVEIIRIGSRLPVICPMRIDEELLQIFKKHKPIYLMTHFNHPEEISVSSAQALEALVDSGVPVFNQMVLLNGVNNSASVVQALSRRLLYLRVKPYYMFQMDPSKGSDHLRTSVDDSLGIQKELWGHISGLMMPNFVVDVPGGGGKAPYAPRFEVEKEGVKRLYQGWDGVQGEYISPESVLKPSSELFSKEWERTKGAKASLETKK